MNFWLKEQVADPNSHRGWSDQEGETGHRNRGVFVEELDKPGKLCKRWDIPLWLGIPHGLEHLGVL